MSKDLKLMLRPEADPLNGIGNKNQLAVNLRAVF